jgi:hypothetical protein
VATISNLYIDQGTTFSTIIDLTNQDGSPMNLTGFTIQAQIRKSYQSSTFTNFTASVYGTPTNGQIRLQLTPSVSSAMRAGRYLYDIEITNTTTQDKYRVLEGIVVISPEITR